MTRFLDISLIITSVGLILSVILQSKGAGLGGLTGADPGAVKSRDGSHRGRTSGTEAADLPGATLP